MGRNYFNTPNWALSPSFTNIEVSVTSGFDLLDAIVNCLALVGWTRTHTFANGVTMLGTSPQIALGLSVYVTLLAYTNALTIQFSGTSADGVIHTLNASGGYVITASNCQLIVHCPYYENSIHGSVAMGGIPFIQPLNPYQPDLPMPTEVWWSQGDYFGSPFFSATTFRDSLGYIDAYGAEHTWCGFYEPVPSTQIPPHPYVTGNQAAALQCEQLAFVGAASSQFMFPNGVPYLYEPMLSWGDYSSTGDFTDPLYTPKIRGQMWDSYISTGPQYLDTYFGGPGGLDGVVFCGKGLMWINFTVGSFQTAGLNLRWILWGNSPVGNYVY